MGWLTGVELPSKGRRSPHPESQPVPSLRSAGEELRSSSVLSCVGGNQLFGAALAASAEGSGERSRAEKRGVGGFAGGGGVRAAVRLPVPPPGAIANGAEGLCPPFLFRPVDSGLWGHRGIFSCVLVWVWAAVWGLAGGKGRPAPPLFWESLTGGW